MVKIRFRLLLFLLVLLIIQPLTINAQESQKLPAITVINPIRGSELGLEKSDLLKSLNKQWSVTKEFGVSATWLWQYSALEDERLVSFAKKEMTDQEYGLFLEVDRNLAAKSDVLYRGRGPWYFSDGLFIFSYDPAERRKLIDNAFALFHDRFGYYPKTVGAWWLTSDSLTYMHERYGVIASLRAADQFDLDVYSIWGTPWGIPYIASAMNAGIPASSSGKSSNVVIMQWAPRDPLRAYGSGQESTYSVQDYFLHNLDISYFNYLADIYLQGPSDQVVIGLEAGLTPSDYDGILYRGHLQAAKDLEKAKRVNIQKAGEFAQRFLSAGKSIERPYLLTKDYKSNDQALWYFSPSMRVGIQKKGDEISLVDLRDYNNAGTDEYRSLPNSQGYLRVDTKALLDTARFPERRQVLAKSSGELSVAQEGDKLTLLSGEEKIAELTPDSVHYLASAINFPNTPQEKLSYQKLFWLLLSLYAGYCAVLFFYLKKPTLVLKHIGLLLIPFLIAYSFFLENSSAGTLLFDKKMLVLSPLLQIPLFSLYDRILIVFWILPFVVLLIAHYLLLIRKKRKLLTIIFYVGLCFITLLFVRVPYFPLDRSTYLYVLAVVGSIGFIGVVGTGIYFLRTRSTKKAFVPFSGIIVFLLLLSLTIFLSRTRLILTPFELNALEEIARRKSNVTCLMSPTQPIYKAIKPILLKDAYVGAFLTGVRWKTRILDKQPITLREDQLLFVPRYLGADLPPDRAKKERVVKIFDNGSIVIYTPNKVK